MDALKVDEVGYLCFDILGKTPGDPDQEVRRRCVGVVPSPGVTVTGEFSGQL